MFRGWEEPTPSLHYFVELSIHPGRIIGREARRAETHRKLDGCRADCLTHISHVPQAFIGLAGAYNYDNTIPTLGWSEPFAQFTSMGNLGNNPEVEISLLHGSRDTNVPAEVADNLYTKLHEAGYTVALHIADTRHAELIDPTDPAGALAVETIITATRRQILPGRTGPATTSIYQRLATQQR